MGGLVGDGCDWDKGENGIRVVNELSRGYGT